MVTDAVKYESLEQLRYVVKVGNWPVARWVVSIERSFFEQQSELGKLKFGKDGALSNKQVGESSQNMEKDSRAGLDQ